MNNKFRILKYIITGAIFLLSSYPSFGAGKIELKETEDGQVIVEGVIRDANTKNPINAAQISIPDKKISGVTDENGQFKLTLQTGDEVLHITAFDYNKMEFPVQGKTGLVIDMYPIGFPEYFKNVIAPSGDVTDNSALTSAQKSTEKIGQVTDITADGILRKFVGGDVRTITRSGMTAIGNSMFIRGFNSLNVNAQPLFVVDGVVCNNAYDFKSAQKGYFNNPLEFMDVNDIESITVLKDGASIYGAKAANGVILINTKRAKSMVTKIALNVFFGMTETPELTPMMDGDDYRIYASDMLNSMGSLAAAAFDKSFLGSPSDVKNSPYYNNTNWADEVYQTGFTQNYLVNVDGGDESAMYYFSLGYTGNDGVVKTTDFQRLNARFNVDANLASILKMAMNINFSKVDRTLLDDGVDNYTSPTWQSIIKAPFLSPYEYTASGEKTKRYAFLDAFGIANPTGVIESALNKLTKYRFSVGVTPVLTLMPGLTLRSQFDYSMDKYNERYFRPMDYAPVKYIDNKGYSYNQPASQAMRHEVIYDDTRLSYENIFGKSHSLKAMYGIRYIYRNLEADYVTSHNTGSNTQRKVDSGKDYRSVFGINNTSKSISNYFNVDYDYNKKYFLSATMSLDASSRYGSDVDAGISMFGAPWGVFPSVNGSWLFSSEKFMKHAPIISFGKLRLGYGITGNDDIPDYQSMSYLSPISFASKASGLVITNLANNKIQWEQTARVNAGIDLGLFKDRLFLTLDVYQSKTDNLLVQQDLDERVGGGKYWTNGGSLENKGYEFTLDAKVLNLKDFRWDLGFGIGQYKNKVTSLVNKDGYFLTDAYDGQVITQVGQAAGLFYGYKTQGVFATAEEANKALLLMENSPGSYSQFKAGDVHFEDINKDKFNYIYDIIDEKDKQVIGDPNPDFYGSINSSWMYKRFKLDALFTYSYGNDVYNYYRRMLESGKDFNNQTRAMNNRWLAEGQQTDQPRATWGDPMGNSRFSDRWIEDGSYFKLKNLALSYELPLKNDFIRGINIWLAGSNLFTISNYLGVDPEFSVENGVLYQGIDAGLLPISRSYSIGFRIDL